MKITSYLEICIKLGIVVSVLVFSGCATSSLYVPDRADAGGGSITGSSNILPGWQVRYYDEKYQHITDMPKGSQLPRFGREGEPVLRLNNVYSKTSNVFNSGKSQLIGFWFHGLIHLEESGLYLFQALANDGVRFYLNRQLIFEDPFKHSNRLTPVGTFKADAPGWYPVQMLYFQRKGTAALRFYWKKPGSSSFEVVPASALGHTI